MAKKALLIIDMLNDFVLEGAVLEVPQARKIISSIQREIEEARKKEEPVIYLCDAHEPDDREFEHFGWPAHGVKGTSGAQIIDELKPSMNDFIIGKPTYSAYYHTKLEDTIKGLTIDTVRLTGCVTHICVLGSAFETAARGYHVEVVKNGVAGLNLHDHEAALRIMEVFGAKII